MKRRRVLATTLVTTIGLLGVVGYRIATTRGNKIETIGARELPPTSPPAVPDRDFLSVFVTGDTGTATPQRRRVVEQMAERARDVRLDMVILLGDNFYDSGVTSVDDQRWQTDFELPFEGTIFQVPFFPCLGNHDHRGNVQAQIDYSIGHPRWRMPAPYYTLIRPITDDISAEFFVLDSTPIAEESPSQTEQVKWLDKHLARSTARWKIVAGHHPIVSGGEHGGSVEAHRLLAPLFEKYGVDLYMSGHDHDLQLHDSAKGWLQLVSGAGAQLRTVHWLESTLFAEATPGFAWLLLTPDEMAIEIIGADGHEYTHRIVKESLYVSRL